MSLLSRTHNWISAKALGFCAKRGFNRTLKGLIWLGLDVNARDAQQNTPLHIACKYESLEAIRILVAANANIFVLNAEALSPLEVFDISAGGKLNSTQIQQVRSLLNVVETQQPVPINAPISTGVLTTRPVANVVVTSPTPTPTPTLNQPSPNALREYNEAIRKPGLSNSELITVPEINGMPLFHYAAANGLVSILKYLLGLESIDKNAKHTGGKTALHFATENGQLAATALLVAAGADTLALDGQDKTPLFDAVHGYETNNISSYTIVPSKTELLASKPSYSKAVINKEAADKASMYLQICLAVLNATDRDLKDFVKQPLGQYRFEKYCSLLHYAVLNNANALHIGELYNLKVMVDDWSGALPRQAARCIDKDYSLPVHHAIKMQQFDVAKILLMIDKDELDPKNLYLNERDIRENRSPLDWAVIVGNLEIVGSLLKQGADAKTDKIKKTFDEYHTHIKTPLLRAAELNRTEIALALIPHSNVAKEYDNDWENKILPPIYHAAKHNNDTLFDALRTADAKLTIRHHTGYVSGQARYQSESLLHLAARIAEDETVINVLVRYGANPHAIGISGNSVLHNAAFNKKFNTMQVFIRLNVNLNLQNKNMDTALHVVIKEKNIAARKSLLLEPLVNKDLLNNENVAPLHLAIQNNDVDAVRELLESGADINLRASDGFTPMHLAISFFAVNELEVLLAHDANLALKNRQDQTPLQYAVTWMERVKANENFFSSDKHLERRAKATAKMIRLILEYKLNNNLELNEINEQGQGLVHLATEAGSLGALVVLKKFDFDINAKNADQKTCLDIAAKKSNLWSSKDTYLKIINFLILKGANFLDSIDTLTDREYTQTTAQMTILNMYRSMTQAKRDPQDLEKLAKEKPELLVNNPDIKQNPFLLLSGKPIRKILSFCFGETKIEALNPGTVINQKQIGFVEPIINSIAKDFDNVEDPGAKAKQELAVKRSKKNPALLLNKG